MSSTAYASPGGARAGALDALRFLAAAFIVLYHFGPNAPVPLSDVAPVFERGWLATDFFLMLSGYILGRAYGEALDARRLSLPRFVLRRVVRVWPAQLMVLAGLASLVLVAGVVGVTPGSPERFQWPDLFAQAALVHAWGLTGQAGWNEPSWTLSALVVCYVAFPLIWAASRPLHGRGAAIVVGLVLVGGCAWLSLALLGRSLVDLPFHMGVIRALPLFALGALLARFTSGRKLSRAFSLATGLAALGGAVALQAADRSEATVLITLAAIAAIIVCCDGLRLSSPPWLRTAADLSFALFITHALSGAAWFGMTGVLGLEDSWLAWGLGYVAALLLAGLFHRLADQPVQHWIRAWLARPRPEPAPERQAA